MAVTSGFYNSLNGDRKYSSEQFSALFDSLIIDGVFANIGTAFAVTVTSDTTLTVGVGRAWFNSTWLYNDTLYPMTPMDAEILLNRIDAIVIEINHNQSVRNGQIRWVYGNPANEPVRPTLTSTDEVHQYPLAYVYRKAGVNKMTQADVTNMVGSSSCPYVSGILSTQNIDNVVAQWQTQFNLFMDGLEESLSGDIASNLTAQVLDLQNRFRELASEQAVYEALQDSSGNVIKDSYNGDVLAATSLGGGDGTVIVNYPTSNDVTTDDISAVGDIIDTTRTDMSSDWALCNGETLSRSSYPALSELMPVTPEGPWTGRKEIVGGTTTKTGFTKILKFNSYYIAVPWTGGDNEQLVSRPYIYYATSPSGTWTKKTFGSGTYTNTIFHDAKILNGRLILMGGALKSGGTFNPTIWYTTAPTGTWTEKVIATNANASDNAMVSDMIYESSQYRCCFVYYNSSSQQKVRCGYSTNLSTWTLYGDTNISPSVYGRARLAHVGSTYVIYLVGTGRMYYASSFSATSWTSSPINTASYIDAKDIRSLDGKLIILGATINDTIYRPAFWVLEESSIKLGNIDYVISCLPFDVPTGYVSDMIYAGGFYVVCGMYSPTEGAGNRNSPPISGKAFVSYSKSLNGPWTTVYDIPGTPIEDTEGNSYHKCKASPSISHTGTGFIMGMTEYEVSTSYYTGTAVWINESLIQLPSIASNSEFYSYIKVR